MSDVDGHTALLQHWLEQSNREDGATAAQARERLLEHTAGRLERLTRKMLHRYPRLRRWEQTGDVLQNALLRLHRGLAAVRLRSVREFFALAATQIRRELIDLSRHHFGPEGQARHHHTDPDPIAEDPHDPHGEPATLLQWAEFHQQVERLPETERETFDLLWYQGLTQKEAAGLLGVTERTIKNRWRSAKLLLGERLDRPEG